MYTYGQWLISFIVIIIVCSLLRARTLISLPLSPQADGDLAAVAQQTATEYISALKFLRRRFPCWSPEVCLCVCVCVCMCVWIRMRCMLTKICTPLWNCLEMSLVKKLCVYVPPPPPTPPWFPVVKVVCASSVSQKGIPETWSIMQSWDRACFWVVRMDFLECDI